MEDYGYESDSDLDDPGDFPDESGTSLDASHDLYMDDGTQKQITDQETRNYTPDAQGMPDSSGILLEPAHIRTFIFLKDTAHATWQALVYHAYTGEIVFSRLRSESTNRDNMAIDNGRFQCSPKSMYRLADKLRLDDLKKEAFKALTERVTEDNVLEEIFSRFTSRYPEVLEMEVEALCKYWDSPKVMAEFPKKMARVAAGGYPHSFSVLAKFSPLRLKH